MPPWNGMRVAMEDSGLNRRKRSLMMSLVRRSSTPPSVRPRAIWLKSSARAMQLMIGSAA